jgi:hypothetical protein
MVRFKEYPLTRTKKDVISEYHLHQIRCMDMALDGFVGEERKAQRRLKSRPDYVAAAMCVLTETLFDCQKARRDAIIEYAKRKGIQYLESEEEFKSKIPRVCIERHKADVHVSDAELQKFIQGEMNAYNFLKGEFVRYHAHYDIFGGIPGTVYILYLTGGKGESLLADVLGISIKSIEIGKLWSERAEALETVQDDMIRRELFPYTAIKMLNNIMQNFKEIRGAKTQES